MAKPRFLFSTSRTITQPYRDEDTLETPYSVAVTSTHADDLTSSDALAPTPILAHDIIDAPSKEVYTQLNAESTQIPGYPLQEIFVLSGPSTPHGRRHFWMVLSLVIGVLLIFSMGVGVGVGISSSLHDLAKIKSNNGSGVDIGSGIHIRIRRGTGNGSDSGDGGTSSNGSGGFCIGSQCPGGANVNNTSKSGNSTSSCTVPLTSSVP